MPRKLPPHLKGLGMPGPQACAAAPLRMALQGGVLPPPQGVGDTAPYSTDAPGRRALTRIFTKNIGFP